MIYLTGGPATTRIPSTYNPDAPDGIRGEYKPIATQLPGVHICEHLPRIAGLMDRVAVIRSIVGLHDEHSSSQSVTGFPRARPSTRGGPTSARSWADPGRGRARGAALLRPVPRIPAHTDCDIPGPGFLGAGFPGRLGWSPGTWQMLSPPAEVPPPRFDRRKALLGQFDRFRRRVDNAEVAGMDAIYPTAPSTS